MKIMLPLDNRHDSQGGPPPAQQVLIPHARRRRRRTRNAQGGGGGEVLDVPQTPPAESPPFYLPWDMAKCEAPTP